MLRQGGLGFSALMLPLTAGGLPTLNKASYGLDQGLLPHLRVLCTDEGALKLLKLALMLLL